MVPVTVEGQTVRMEAPDDGFLIDYPHRGTQVLDRDLADADSLYAPRPSVERQPEEPEPPMPRLQGHYHCGCPGMRYNRDEYRRWLNGLQAYREDFEAAEGEAYARSSDGEPRPLDWPGSWSHNRCSVCGQAIQTAGVD